MVNLTDVFIEKLISKNELQKKYIKTWSITSEEREELNEVLKFLVDEYNAGKYDIDFIVDSYLFLNNMVMEETYYFVKNGKYRYSTFEEVDKLVYDNEEYMEKYMIGVLISQYIWVNHMKMIRYFVENADFFYGDKYLEIGPGFGQYLIKAITKCNFNEYYACDVSESSTQGSNQYLKHRGYADRCSVEYKNFFDYSAKDKFDCIVMGEVLEHTEKPKEMLQKIYELLAEKGKAFITTVINAPTLDHIYLFNNIEEVLDIVSSVGFNVDDYQCSTAGDIPLEKAIKKKQAINIAMILSR